jgi:hypothetical protein
LNGILADAGLSPVPTAWRNAIKGTFLLNTDGLGLTIAATGSGGTCSASGIIGG